MKKILLSLSFVLAFCLNGWAQTIISQDFEGTMAPWTVATTGGGAGWTIVSGATATQLGTIAAHTKYAVVNEGILSATAFNNPTKITSPTFSLVGVTTPYLSFDWMYYQAWLSAPPYTHELAWIEISTDGGSAYSLLDSFVYSPSSNWSSKFISLAAYTSSATCVLRFCYTDQGDHIIGIAVDNIRVYDGATTDLGITSVAPVAGSVSSYYMTGTGATISGTVTNFSATALTSFTAYYQVGTAAPVSTVVSTGAPALTAGTPFTISTPYILPSATQQNVKVWVTATSDVNTLNDSMNTAVVGVAFMPKKRLCYEEATGSWCGWCVRGMVYMDSLWRAHPDDVTIISIHNNDPMRNMNSSTMAYDGLISGMVSGFPSMVIDRRVTTDPGNAFSAYSAQSGIFGFADMGLKYTTSGGAINGTVRIKPAFNMSGDYRLELIVEEDDVHKGGGAGGSNGWKQHNYYAVGGSGHSTPMHTIGFDFNNLPADIDTPTIRYQFVARTTLPANVSTTNGVAGSLPASMTASTNYDWTIPTITIDPSWDATKLRVVALLIDNNSANSTYRQILNSVTTKGLYLSIADVQVGINNMTVYPNPATDIAHVKFILNDAVDVSCTVYDMMGHIVFVTPVEQMNAGGHQINFSTSDLASGIYNVVVKTDAGTTSQRLSIVK